MPVVLSQSLNPDSFTARNFMFVPIERVTDPPTTRPGRPPSGPFRGLIILSGVAIIGFAGEGREWRRDLVELDLNEDLGNAIRLAPYTPQPGFIFGFAIEQFVPFATVNSRFTAVATDAQYREDDGTAADAFALDVPRGAVLNVDVAVTMANSRLERLGYHVSLFGTLVEQPLQVWAA